MKRVSICLLLLLICLTGCSSTGRESTDIWGKAYRVEYSSPQICMKISIAEICLTTDGYLVWAPPSLVKSVKMEPIRFRKNAFLALCDFYHACESENPAYTEYICENVEDAWYGKLADQKERFWYVLRLKDGSLLVAYGYNPQNSYPQMGYEGDIIVDIHTLVPDITQQEYFDSWNQEAMQWDTEWEELYVKYGK